MRLFKVRKSSDLQQHRNHQQQLGEQRHAHKHDQQNQLDLNTNQNVSNGSSSKNNQITATCINRRCDNSANFITETKIILQRNYNTCVNGDHVGVAIEPVIDHAVIINDNINNNNNNNHHKNSENFNKSENTTPGVVELQSMKAHNAASEVNNVCDQNMIEQYCDNGSQMLPMIGTATSASQCTGKWHNIAC